MSSPTGGGKKASKASSHPKSEPKDPTLGRDDPQDGFQSARSKKKGSKAKKKERGDNRQENQQEEEERGTPPNLESVGGASQNSFSALADPEEQGGDPAASDDEEEEEGAISSSSSSLHADILADRAKAEPATVHTLLAPGSLLEKVLANAVQKAIENDREPPAWVMQLLTGAPVSNPGVTQFRARGAEARLRCCGRHSRQ